MIKTPFSPFQPQRNRVTSAPYRVHAHVYYMIRDAQLASVHLNSIISERLIENLGIRPFGLPDCWSTNYFAVDPRISTYGVLPSSISLSHHISPYPLYSPSGKSELALFTYCPGCSWGYINHVEFERKERSSFTTIYLHRLGDCEVIGRTP